LHPGVLVPPDLFAGRGLVHHELVLGRAPGMGRRDRGERPMGREVSLVTPDRLLDELRRIEVCMDRTCADRLVGGRLGGSGSALRAHRLLEGSVSLARSGRRPRSCASTAAMTAMLTMSSTAESRSSTCTGAAGPTRIGPIACAPPSRPRSL